MRVCSRDCNYGIPLTTKPDNRSGCQRQPGQQREVEALPADSPAISGRTARVESGRPVGRDRLTDHLAVAMPVVQVWIVGMAVSEKFVTMQVGMRFCYRPIVAVLMVFVMHVRVVVFERLVIVPMLMAFREMQIKPDGHEQTGPDQLWRERLAEQHKGEKCPDKGRQGKVGAGAGGAEMAQAKHEHHEADADAEEADQGSGRHNRRSRHGRSERQCQGQVRRPRD